MEVDLSPLYPDSDAQVDVANLQSKIRALPSWVEQYQVLSDLQRELAQFTLTLYSTSTSISILSHIKSEPAIWYCHTIIIENLPMIMTGFGIKTLVPRPSGFLRCFGETFKLT